MLGATLVIAKSGGHMDPSYIASLINQHQVSSLVFTVPTLVRKEVKDLSLPQGGRTIEDQAQLAQSLGTAPGGERCSQLTCLCPAPFPFWQANEWMKAPELQPPVLSMRSWGLGGEAVPLDILPRMHKVCGAGGRWRP